MTEEEKIICKQFLHDADKTHSCNEYKLLMALLEQEPTIKNEAKYCDRNICLKNEYNNIGCEDCEVTKSQEPTTKNDLGVDAISRQAINGYIDYILSHGMGKKKSFDFIKKFVANLPSVTPQEPHSFKWCTNCKEYDQEKHCCHRYSKVIRDTVTEIRQESRKGHWIENAPQYDMLNPQYICSECGNAHTRTTPYCEMCGAKMESEG